MHQEQNGFIQRFKGWAGNILQEFGRLIDNLLSMWINEFLGGMIRSLAGGFGGRVASALGLGVAGSAIGGGTAAAAGSAAAATSVLESSALAGFTPAASTGAGGAAGALAMAGPLAFLAAAGYFAFRPPEWTKVNPNFLKAINAEMQDPNGEHDWRKIPNVINARRPRGFSMGGFVPPNTVMPAILHGGSMGEAVIPLDKIGKSSFGSGHRIENHIHITAIDAKGVRDFVKSKDFTDSLAQVTERNSNFFTSRLVRATDGFGGRR